MTQNMTRGERNNNPGNIDRNTIQWQGLALDQSADPRFCVFKTPKWGLRALAITLLNYQRLHGLKTVRDIIHRFAPGVENDTTAYQHDVAEQLGVNLDYPINLESPAVLSKLTTAVVRHENGRCIYPTGAVMDAVNSALGRDEETVG